MSLPELCIRRPVMTTLLMISFIVVGIFGYQLLPVAALPRVDFPTINVSASLPGASPETMASSVATPLERQFATIPGVTTITSTSSQGSTQITLQFDLNRNIDGAALDVQSAISAASRQLPIEMTTPPSFRKVDPADQPILFIVVGSETLPLSAVDEYAETLIAQRISSLSGVAQVQVNGAQKYAVRVQADPNMLSAAGISLDDLQNALSAADSNAPVGTIQGTAQNFTIEASGQLQKAELYKSLIIAYRNGNPVRLGDVAKVIDSVENDQIASWYNDRRSIVLAVQRQPGANTVGVVDNVRALLPTLQAELPASVRMQVIVDRSVSIRQSVNDVQFTLGLAVVLVLIVIFLFLRNATATIIPALALPISIIGTFAGMYLLGFSIDNLSLLALTLAVGFVVDDAIVMLENIVRHIEAGEAPYEAALKGSREIAFTILSITISLVAVFIPVLFMGGVVGRLFNEFAVTISLTILISGIVSLTLTPMLASRLLKPDDHEDKESALFKWSEAAFQWMLKLYDKTLQRALAHRRFMLIVTIASLLGTIILFAVIHKGFFPQEDTGLVFASTEAAQDISFQAMTALQKKVTAVIEADPAVAVANSTVGSGGSNAALNQGRVFIALKPFGQRPPVGRVIQRLRKKLSAIPGMNTFMQPVQNINVGGRLSRSQYQLVLQGTDFAEVERYAPQLQERMSQIPGLQDVTSDLQIKSPQAFVDVDRQKAATLGVTTDAVRRTLYSAFGQRQVATIYTPSNSYQVILELAPQYRNDVRAISSIYVPTTSGGLVPLSETATVTRTVGPVSVDHQGTLPSVLLSFNLAPGMSLGQAVQRIDAVERDMHLPATLSTSYQGTAQVFGDALKGQGLLLLAAIFVIYVVLGILYESFVHPVTSLSGLPAAGLGALLTLMLFGMDLDVIAIIGLVMLIGIVKKNAIMMIDFALERQRNEGASPEQAIYQACLLRFRPIMMTTMAALMGTLPIAIGLGAGSELRRPLGVVVVGGLLTSQLLTLFITPVIYLYLDELRSRMSGMHFGLNWKKLRRALASADTSPPPEAAQGNQKKSDETVG
ncbi:MAG: efflux RND transporter permease subunit [Alphaproteobacteria bacterium]